MTYFIRIAEKVGQLVIGIIGALEEEVILLKHDMETGAIAQVCALHGVRFASIRSISDSASGEDGAMQFQKFLKLASSHSVFVIEDILSNI